MSCIHYKFRAALDYKTLTFDGFHISVADLKREICEKETIRAESFDLELTNAQTKRVYQSECNELIPRNSSVIVKRVPRENAQKLPKIQDRSTEGLVIRGQSSSASGTNLLTEVSNFAMMTEEERIAHIKEQATRKYHPSNYQRRGSSIMTGIPPPTYTCNRCHRPGHWFKNCPMLSTRRTTGIPSEELVITTSDDPQAYLHPSGKYVVPIMHRKARELGKKEKLIFDGDESPVANVDDPRPTIPDELQCPLCTDLLRDAVLSVCCGDSFCDECIRQTLIDSELKECPGRRCQQIGVSPDSLVPNMNMRRAVDAFRNDSGYTHRPRGLLLGEQPNATIGVDQPPTRIRIGLPPLSSTPPTLPSVLSSLMSQTVIRPQSSELSSFNRPQPTQQTLSSLEAEAAVTSRSTTSSNDQPLVCNDSRAHLITVPPQISLATNQQLTNIPFHQYSMQFPFSSHPLSSSICPVPVATVYPQITLPVAPFSTTVVNALPLPVSSSLPISSCRPQPPPPGLPPLHPPPSSARAIGSFLPTTATVTSTSLTEARDAWDDFIERKDRKRRKSRQSSSSSSESSQSSSSDRSRSRSISRDRRYRRRSQSRSRSVHRRRRRSPAPDWMRATAAAIADNRGARHRTPDWLQNRKSTSIPYYSTSTPPYHSTRPTPLPFFQHSHPGVVAAPFSSFGQPTLAPAYYSTTVGGYYLPGTTVPPPMSTSVRTYPSTTSYSTRSTGRYQAHSPSYLHEERLAREHRRDGREYGGNRRDHRERTSRGELEREHRKKYDKERRSSRDRRRSESVDNDDYDQEYPIEEERIEAIIEAKVSDPENKSERSDKRLERPEKKTEKRDKPEKRLDRPGKSLDTPEKKLPKKKIAKLDRKLSQIKPEKRAEKLSKIESNDKKLSLKLERKKFTPTTEMPSYPKEIDNQFQIETMFVNTKEIKLEPTSVDVKSNLVYSKLSANTIDENETLIINTAKKHDKPFESKKSESIMGNSKGESSDAPILDEVLSSPTCPKKTKKHETESTWDEDYSPTHGGRSKHVRNRSPTTEKKKHKRKHKKKHKKDKKKSKSGRSKGSKKHRHSDDHPKSSESAKSEVSISPEPSNAKSMSEGENTLESTQVQSAATITTVVLKKVSPSREIKPKLSLDSVFDKPKVDFGNKKITMMLNSVPSRQVAMKRTDRELVSDNEGQFRAVSNVDDQMVVITSERHLRHVSVDEDEQVADRIVNVDPDGSADLSVTFSKEKTPFLDEKQHKKSKKSSKRHSSPDELTKHNR